MQTVLKLQGKLTIKGHRKSDTPTSVGVSSAAEVCGSIERLDLMPADQRPALDPAARAAGDFCDWAGLSGNF